MNGKKPRLSGWSRHNGSERGWRRSRDWTGWHTIIAATVGIAIPLVVAALTGVLSVGPEVPDLVGDLEALEERYEHEWDTAFEQARAVAYAERMYELAANDDAPWAVGFRSGWDEGRRDVATAMHQAAVEQNLGELRVEWQVLAQLERSLPQQQ